MLVEQNATMALAVADSAFVLDVGRVSLSGPAAELARTDAVQRLYLGHGSAAEALPGVGEDAASRHEAEGSASPAASGAHAAEPEGAGRSAHSAERGETPRRTLSRWSA
jgi:hypothetical protein